MSSMRIKYKPPFTPFHFQVYQPIDANSSFASYRLVWDSPIDTFVPPDQYGVAEVRLATGQYGIHPLMPLFPQTSMV